MSVKGTDLHAVMEVLRVAEAASDADTFGNEILPTLRHLVPSDAAIYNEVELARQRVEFLTEPVDVGASADNGALNRCLDQHPIARYHAQTGDGSAVRIADFLPACAYHRLELYHDFYRPLEVEHHMIAALGPKATPYIALSFNRSARPFSERDRAVLNLLRPHLRAAYAMVRARGKATAIAAGKCLPGDQHALVLLDGYGQPERFVGHAACWLRAYFPTGSESSLPDEVALWAKHERCRWSARNELPVFPEPLTRESDRGELAAYFLPRLEPSDRDMLLLVERPRHHLRQVDLARLGLTKRQGQVLESARLGLTDAQIAQVLFLSVHTVKKHLEQIYNTLGVHNRTAAIAAAYGYKSTEPQPPQTADG